MKSVFKFSNYRFGTVFLPFLAGLIVCFLWLQSRHHWDNYLSNAFISGVALYEALENGTDIPRGFAVETLDETSQQHANQGAFEKLQNVPKPSLVTRVSIHQINGDQLASPSVQLAIISSKLQYPIAQINSSRSQSTGEKLGDVLRLLATYCSEPIIFARLHSQAWTKIDGRQIYGCAAAPRDLRLLAILIAVIVLSILWTRIVDFTSHFDRFAQALKTRRRFGGPEQYPQEGPDELKKVVRAVNHYLEFEREGLSNRATVLSGVSHDLGTPATRLRLRAALIEDDDLRSKFEADIDSMTDMIESVLTYTRAELDSEEPRQISLLYLIESIVDDYSDTGMPVTFEQPGPILAEGKTSVFSAHSGKMIVDTEQPILVIARPTSLKRALSNLIDNALKYGRSAHVSLNVTSERAQIIIEDQGSELHANDIEQFIAPYRRGSNTQNQSGYGLGLTIVKSIADQHDGRLWFEDGHKGLKACFEIAR